MVVNLYTKLVTGFEMSKKVIITFVGDPETKERLEQLASDTERSQSGFLRWLIGNAWHDRYRITESGKNALEETRKNSK